MKQPVKWNVNRVLNVAHMAPRYVLVWVSHSAKQAHDGILILAYEPIPIYVGSIILYIKQPTGVFNEHCKKLFCR